MGLIYMRISPSGGKYIGQTVRPENIRWKQHCKQAFEKNYSDYNSILNRAIRKYGADNFTVKILEDNISMQELNNKQQYYIEKYNTYYKDNPEFGYNMTRGGQLGTQQYTDDFILNLWNTGKTIKELKQQYHLNYNNLLNRLKNLGISHQQIAQRAYYDNNTKRKKVAQYTLNNEYIQTFSSITAAANAVQSNTTNISSVCNGKRKSCKGYIWKYINQ